MIRSIFPGFGAISPLVKSGGLTHKITSPPPSTEPSRSICCIPEQAVNAAFSIPATKKGRFLIFYRFKYIIGDHTAQEYSTEAALAMCRGWEFELKTDGTVQYMGPYSGLESDTLKEWTRATSEPRKLICPGKPADVVRNVYTGRAISAGEDQQYALTPVATQDDYIHSGSNMLVDSSIFPTYRYALYGVGDHTSVVSTTAAATGYGTWRLLMNEPEKAQKTTHVMYISLPELISHLIACGLSPEDIPRALEQGKWGCLKLCFSPSYWRGPESIMRRREIKPEEWKEGWWYTWRFGMEIWVC